MTKLRHSMSAHAAAAIAIAALVLQALLLSVTAPSTRAAEAIEQLALHSLCLARPEQRGSDEPFPVPPHANHGCCILCTVPGLAAGGAVIAVRLPSWDAPLAAPMSAARPRAVVVASERAPIQARAPPA